MTPEPTPAEPTPAEPAQTEHDSERLLGLLRDYGSVAVAFSAGVDSTVVAKAARLALGDHAVAVTGVGPALSPTELDTARDLTREIGIRHVEVNTHEIQKPSYVNNGPDRCFHCKDELYTQLHALKEELGVRHIANGANTDDLQDYRPGMRAASQHRVRSPLLEADIDKEGVRRLAKRWRLPIWDKPAAPCLASRLAYGQTVTPERLARIDAAEQWVRARGPREVRVRLLEGDAARVEVPLDWVDAFSSEPLFAELSDRLLELGFTSVSLDPEGFRSGRMNQVLPLLGSYEVSRHEKSE